MELCRMGLFGFFKKKKIELTEEQLKWNKMWELWAQGKVDSPYAELMTYQGEINNGGHYQYFTNVENTGNISKEISALQTILPENLKKILPQAYEAYLTLEEKENEKSEEIITQSDKVFFENEEKINRILEEYAAKIEL